jgi:hypothetical protein
MNQEFHDHLDICEQCRNHPLHLCAVGVRLLYASVTNSAAPSHEDDEVRRGTTAERQRGSSCAAERTERRIIGIDKSYDCAYTVS